MQNEKPNIKKLAVKYGTCTKTIRRWLKAGAPFHDAKRMRLWLAARKHRPMAADVGHSPPPADVPVPVPTTTTEGAEVKLAQGAAYALTRLERAEAAAFEEYDAALQSKDPQ